MKFVRFLSDQKAAYGVVDGDAVKEMEGSPFGDYRITAVKRELSSVKLLPPCEPSKIVCMALNYRSHADEVGKGVPEEPELFIKPSTCVIGPEDNIVYPKLTQKMGFEAELGIVIKKRAKDIPLEAVWEYILGYTCFNDVSARDIQRKEKHRTRAKSFDTFAPLGPFLVTDIDPGNLQVRSYLNGKIVQSSTTAELIFDVMTMVSFISHSMTLLPGDVIGTGTPANPGLMAPGDVIEIEVEKVGRLKNTVVSA